MADVLQEYLVGLGFKVEKAGLEAFQKALKGGATQAVAFGTIWAKVAEEAVDAAGAVVKATFAMAQQLDTLYFAGIRVQDTAQNVAAAGYAFSQMGSNAQAARQALAGIADFVRTTPGGLNFMASLGIVTTDENGKPLSTEKLLENAQRMIHAMNATQPALADQYRQMFGLSVEQMLMDPDKFDDAMDEYRQIREALHLTGDASVETGHQFEHSWTRMKEVVGSVAESFVTEFMPEMTESMDAFSDMLTGKWSQSGEHWARSFRDVGETVQRAVEQAEYSSAKIWEGQGVITHAQALAIRDRIRQRRRALAARTRVEGAQDTAENAGLSGDDDDSLDAGVASSTPRSDAQARAKRQAEFAVQAAAAAREAAGRGDKAEESRYAGIAHQAALAAAAEARTAAGSPPDDGAPPAGGLHTRPRRAIDTAEWNIGDTDANFLMQHGVPPEIAIGIAAGVVGEGGTATAWNRSGGGQGARYIGQWRGGRQRKAQEMFGTTDPTLVQQMRYQLLELLGLVPGERAQDIASGQAVLHSRTAVEAFGRYIDEHMAPGPAGALGDKERGLPYLMGAAAAAGVTIYQKTDITVSGVTDPMTAGQRVLEGQESVNGRLARNVGQNHAY